jgi:DNA-binding XRE family transcriptional regulator
MTLRERRLRLGLTQADLAARLGVRRITIVRLEDRGELPLLYDLAMATLEARHVTAPDYPQHRNRPRQRRQE